MLRIGAAHDDVATPTTLRQMTDFTNPDTTDPDTTYKDTQKDTRMDDRAENTIGVAPLDASSPTENSARRHLLKALVAGGIAAIAVPAIGSRAGAASDGSTELRNPADNARLNAAIERETRMVTTCKAAVDATSDADFKAAFLLIHDHHLAYAQAFKGYLGSSADTPKDTSVLAPVAGDAATIAAALATLEDQTVAIHLGILADLKGADAASLVASIITTEARHGAALAMVSGSSPVAAAGN